MQVIPKFLTDKEHEKLAWSATKRRLLEIYGSTAEIISRHDDMTVQFQHLGDVVINGIWHEIKNAREKNWSIYEKYNTIFIELYGDKNRYECSGGTDFGSGILGCKAERWVYGFYLMSIDKVGALKIYNTKLLQEWCHKNFSKCGKLYEIQNNGYITGGYRVDDRKIKSCLIKNN